jgi:hypothetical protein
MDNKLPVPGSAARSAEQETRTPNSKIEPGSAARIAEQSAHETTAVPRQAFRGTINIRTRASTGAKFEFSGRVDGPGEALPEGYKAPPPAAANQSVNAETSNPVSRGMEAAPEATAPAAGTWSGRFRKLFGG